MVFPLTVSHEMSLCLGVFVGESVGFSFFEVINSPKK